MNPTPGSLCRGAGILRRPVRDQISEIHKRPPFHISSDIGYAVSPEPRAERRGTMAVIAITGRKGGIRKSTITANLAAELVALGRAVVVLDTDPQKSLVAWAELGEGLLREIVEAVDRPVRLRGTEK